MRISADNNHESLTSIRKKSVNTTTEIAKNPEVALLLERIDNSDISSSRRVISEIIEVINDRNSTAKDLKDIIELDPSLTMKVLRFANSAYYGRAREVSEIQEAIIWIGFDALKELALNQKVYELFEKNLVVGDYSRLELWKHSVAVALCSKLIYRREFGRRGDAIYAAGLLHNIGILIHDQFMHEQFTQMLEQMTLQRKNLHEVEFAALGYTHAQIAGVIARRWALPEDLTNSIAHHKNPTSLGGTDDAQSGYTLFVADHICQQREIGFCDTPYGKEEIYRRCLRDLEIKERALGFIADEVENEIALLENEGWFTDDDE